MKMDSSKKEIKRRRQERLRLIKEKQKQVELPGVYYSRLEEEEDYPGAYLEPYAPRYYSLDHRRKSKSQSLFLFIKIVCAAFLVGGSYLIMHSTNPNLASTQQFIQEVFQRNYNVKGVVAWYEAKLGTSPAFLPHVINREEKNPAFHYGLPVTRGEVISVFGQEQSGIIIQTAQPHTPIEVIKEGWVIFVGEKEGLGQTVIIDHGNGEESWYGFLQDVQVLVHDWLDQGKRIGYSSAQEEGVGKFYFALKQHEEFVNPLEVISFD